MKITFILLGTLLALGACKTRDADPDPTPQPKIDASFNLPSPIEVYAPATFQNTSRLAANCRWNFGDGSTSIETTPTHTYTKTGAYTVTLRTYNVFQDSTSASRSFTVQPNPNDVIGQAPIKIPGSYKYNLLSKVSVMGYPTITRSTGVLSVTQTGISAISVTTPETTYSFTYSPNPSQPTLYQFKINDSSGYISTSSSITFYPTGDSLHLDLERRFGLAGQASYAYRGYRQP